MTPRWPWPNTSCGHTVGRFCGPGIFILGMEKPSSQCCSAFLHWPLLSEVVTAALCVFSRFRWRRRLLVISAPNDEDWAYSQQLSALSGQACNFGEWEAPPFCFPIPLSFWMILNWNRALAHTNILQSRCRFTDTYSIYWMWSCFQSTVLVNYRSPHLPFTFYTGSIYCFTFNYFLNMSQDDDIQAPSFIWYLGTGY